MPYWLWPIIPRRIKPACAMDENARNLLRFCWRMAKRLPRVIVRIMMMYNTLLHNMAILLKTVNSRIVRMNAAAPLETTER